MGKLLRSAGFHHFAVVYTRPGLVLEGLTMLWQVSGTGSFFVFVVKTMPALALKSPQYMNLSIYFIIWRKVRTEKSRIAFRPYGFKSLLLFVRRSKFRRQDVIDEINDGKDEYAQSEEIGRISEILAYES